MRGREELDRVYIQRVERYLNKIKTSKSALPYNVNHVLRFVDNCNGRNLSPARITFYLERLYKMADYFKKDFMKVTRDDVDKFLASVPKGNSNWTIDGYIVSLKVFFRFLYNADSDETPAVIKGLKRQKGHNNISKKDLWTWDMLDKLIQSTNDIRLRGLWVVLSQTGMRPDEVFGLKISSVEVKSNMIKLRIDLGKTTKKTGARTVFVMKHCDYFKEFFDAHPRKHDPDAWLFGKLKSKLKKDKNGKVIGREEAFVPLNPGELGYELKKYSKKAGLITNGQRVYPYLVFRHSLAHKLYTSKEVPAAEAARLMGHSVTVGSETYAHIDDDNTQDALLDFWKKPKTEVDIEALKNQFIDMLDFFLDNDIPFLKMTVKKWKAKKDDNL